MTRRNWNIHLENMMKAGVHLGHRTHKWNPRMAPYIAAKRKGKHIINLIRTARFLSEACDLLFYAASRGKTFLIVGTQKTEADLVVRAARMAQCYYVNKKWIRGMLTNWSIIKKRLQKFRKLKAKQKKGFHRLTKKHAAMVKKKLVHFQRYFDGIEDMGSPPHIVIVLNQYKDYQALQECRALEIPTISLIDTNCDPDFADLPIPANDDSTSSIQLILYKLVFAICKGRSL